MKRHCVIKGIECQQDRALLHLTSAYYVIATVSQAKRLAIGDSIAYEPAGINFGWYLSQEEP